MAEVQALAEQVVRAVSVLYGSSPAAQAEANSWLTAFAGVSEAWEVCLALLVPGQAAEVQFYSANTMLKKIREQWGSLSGAARAHLCDTLRWPPHLPPNLQPSQLLREGSWGAEAECLAGAGAGGGRGQGQGRGGI